MESTICGEGKRHVFDNHMTRDSFTSNITKPSEENSVLVASAKYNIHLKTLPLKGLMIKFKKLQVILLFSMDALNLSKLTVKT